ncbi:hypothetical protein N7517_008536 [Penicillium concentricum]|uniref:Uncharacterized protein n=1 Tax=Penicillium concentricum TaxID=293559 RepID=A0A9W9V3Y9_9EURO|nr:uncharacterized protein N7517_008536 [Penicillium concentricum]KAJ5365650.1 hypothetical protein N7517_008536 [Penicillium concentricum]
MSDLWTFTGGFEEISRDSLDSSELPEVNIADIKHLASYNWIEAPEPTIAVPGSPAPWSTSRGPRQLKNDGGFAYSFQKAARVCRHFDGRSEPLFRALYIEKSSFDISSIDVVTDRNNILKFLSFTNPTQSRYVLDSFIIQVDMTTGTAIFCREEPPTYEIIVPAHG